MHNLIVTLGLMLGGATLLALLLRLVKQSSIIAFIGVGMVAGLFRESFHLPEEILGTFTEIGIIMLLFMAGLEVDIASFLKRWRLVVINGLGQVVLLTLGGLAFGWFYMDIEQPAPLIFFALCLTLSSTIIVLGTLKEKRAMDSLHGQVVLGLMVIQDIIAVLALSFLKSIAANAPLLVEVPLVFLKMGILIVVLAVLAKFVLKPVFRFLAQSSEMLFIGTLGYCMGIAGVSELFHFSPEIGAFMAGASLAFLPYRLEIEGKVEPLKSFGVILFFITLGYRLEFKSEMVDILGDVALLSLFVVVGTPLVMLGLGWVTRLKSQPAFMIGGIINQISEFSLILATLCFQAGIFDEMMLAVITLTCLVTFFLSSLGHQFLDHLYIFSRRHFGFIDRRSIPYQIQSHLDFDFEDHIIILSYNEIAHEIADFYKQSGKKVLLIDIDPEIIHYFQTENTHNIVPLYADMDDPDVWEEFHFHKAKIIISCMIRGQNAELGIARWLKERGCEVPFIATTDSHEESLELYDNGVRFVIQTEFIAAESFRQIFSEESQRGQDAFKELAAIHRAKIISLQKEIKSIFKLV